MQIGHQLDGNLACDLMSVSSGRIQEEILQEHLEKEDEVLVSLAGLKQVLDSSTT